MKQFRIPDHTSRRSCNPPSAPAIRISLPWGRGLAAGACLLILVAGAAQTSLQNPDKPLLMPEANRPPDANERMRMQERKRTQQSYDALNAERKKLIADDSEKLVTLAMALKAEADNTPGGEVSPNMLRKSMEIERLAHDVKEKMKLTVEYR
jgi:hypothetical protein